MSNEMSFNERQEELLCQVLKAWIEEFGPEYVQVTVPMDWQGPDHLGKVPVFYVNDDTVGVHVRWNSNVALDYVRPFARA